MKIAYILERPRKETPTVYETDGQESSDDLVVYDHYFIAGTHANWYVLEYDKIRDEIFCFAELIPNCGELGYTSMKELEELVVNVPIKIGFQTIKIPLRVEKEVGWTPKTLGTVLKK